MPIKFLVLGGGVGKGGKCQFNFYGRGDLSEGFRRRLY